MESAGKFDFASSSKEEVPIKPIDWSKTHHLDAYDEGPLDAHRADEMVSIGNGEYETWPRRYEVDFGSFTPQNVAR